MASKIQIRQDITSNWESANPILSSGEFGYDSTLKKFKLGDGTSTWLSLEFYSSAGEFLVSDSPNIQMEEVANGTSQLSITIANYDSSNVYTTHVTAGTLDVSSHPFVWTLPDVDTITPYVFSIVSQELGKVAGAAYKTVSVLPVSSELDDIIPIMTLEGRSDDTFYQGSDEASWNKLMVSIDARNEPIEIASSTTSQLKLKNPIKSGSNLILTDGSGVTISADSVDVTREVVTTPANGYHTEKLVYEGIVNDASSMGNPHRAQRYSNGDILEYTILSSGTVFTRRSPDGETIINSATVHSKNNGVVLTSSFTNSGGILLYREFNVIIAHYTIDGYMHICCIDATSFEIVGDFSLNNGQLIANKSHIAFNGSTIGVYCEYSTAAAVTTQAATVAYTRFGIVNEPFVTIGSTYAKNIYPLWDDAFMLISANQTTGKAEYRVFERGVTTLITGGSLSLEITRENAVNSSTIFSDENKLIFMQRGNIYRIELAKALSYLDFTTISGSIVEYSVKGYTSTSYGLGVFYDSNADLLYTVEGSTLRVFDKTLQLINSQRVFTKGTILETQNMAYERICYTLPDGKFVFHFNDQSGSSAASTFYRNLIKTTTDILDSRVVTYNIDLTPYNMANVVTGVYLKPYNSLDIAYDNILIEAGKQVLPTSAVKSTSATTSTMNPLTNKLYAVDATGNKELLTNVVTTTSTITPTAGLKAPTNAISTGLDTGGELFNSDDGSEVVAIGEINNYVRFVTFDPIKNVELAQYEYKPAYVVNPNVHCVKLPDNKIAVSLSSTTAKSEILIYDISNRTVSNIITRDALIATAHDVASDGTYLYTMYGLSGVTRIEKYRIDTLKQVAKYSSAATVDAYLQNIGGKRLQYHEGYLYSTPNTTFNYEYRTPCDLSSEPDVFYYSSGAERANMPIFKHNHRYIVSRLIAAPFTQRFLKQELNGNIIYSVPLINDTVASADAAIMELEHGVFLVGTLPNAYLIKESKDGLSATILSQYTGLIAGPLLYGYINRIVYNQVSNKLLMSAGGVNVLSMSMTGVSDTTTTITYDAPTITPVRIEQSLQSPITLSLDSVTSLGNATRYKYAPVGTIGRQLKVWGEYPRKTSRVNLELSKEI